MILRTFVEIQMVVRACPLCGCTDQSNVFAEQDFDPTQWDEFAFASRKTPEFMHYRLICCPQCDLLYASPLPTAQMLAKAYQMAAYDSATESKHASNTYARFLPSIMRRLPDRNAALDIGTGDGAFIEHLLAYRFRNVVGVEPSEAAISVAKDNIKPLIKRGLFRSQDFQRQSFSLITCFQTLEHLHNPFQICQDVFALLKPGGAAFFVCHNRHAFSTLLLRLKSPIFDVEHLQLFSKRSARFLFEKSGFEDIAVRTLLNCYPVHYWLKLLPLRRNLKQASMAISKLSGIGHLPLALPAGNIAVVGYKPSHYGHENEIDL